jgi:hypothetical protein
MPQPEQLKQRKNISQQRKKKRKKENTRKTSINIHQTNFYQCEETVLPYNMQH